MSPRFKTQFIALALLLLLYVGVALAHAVLAPLTTGPDELAHYEYVRFIAEHGRLPLNGVERGQASYKSDQPPLYHLIAALPASLVDPTGPPYLKRVSDHPRRQLIERTRHAWGLYNTEDERWPYRAEVLRWQVGRWLAILWGAATVVVTFFTARTVFSEVRVMPQLQGEKDDRQSDPEQGRRGGVIPALAAAAVVAFVPRFALTGSMLNYETTLAFFAALFLWMLLRMAIDDPARGNQQTDNLSGTHPTAYVPRYLFRVSRLTFDAFLLGLFAGLAITAKLSAVILPLEIVFGLWLIRRNQGWSWQLWLQSITVAALGILVAVSWWFGFILYQFNTVTQDGWWVGLLRPLVAADASDATTNRLLNVLTAGQAGFTGAIENLDSGPPWAWLATFFRTFWVVEIEGYVPLGWPGLALAVALCLLAAWGLIGVWRSHDRRRPTDGRRRQEPGLEPSLTVEAKVRLVLSLLVLHVLMTIVLPLLRYATTFSLADTAQGRHVLFLAASAVAILVVWGWSFVAGNWLLNIGRNALWLPRYALWPTFHPSRVIPFIPSLFLLAWSGVQMWAMSWAYHPPLPVRTVPDVTVSQLRNQVINDSVKLVGYETLLDADRSLLRLDVLWQATAISPVDYLTEASLLDQAGRVQAQWLGYPAQGRYPTRTWDVGDFVRDTIWLGLAGLEPGGYQLTLKLVPTLLNSSPEAGSQPHDLPVTLGTITLPGSLHSEQAASVDQSRRHQTSNSNLQVWQNGQLLTVPTTFRYRETILVTFTPAETDQPHQVRIYGPLPPGETQLTGEAPQIFTPVRQVNRTALFIVGPEWPGGRYRLELADGNGVERQVASGPVFDVVDRWQRQFSRPDMNYHLEANFADQVMLLGYDLPAKRAEPGGGVSLTLYWQGLDWMGTDYTIFTKLLAADHTVHGGRDRLPREGYRTIYWAPGEIVSDPFGVPVDADAPDGVYYLNVGLYREVGGQAVSLPLVRNGQSVEASSISIGPLKIGSAPFNLTLDQAQPQVTLNQPFGDPPQLTLLGYDLTDVNNHPLATDPFSVTHYEVLPTNLHLTLYWRSEAPLSLEYTTFVHLRDAAGDIVAQKDQPPLNGAYPTSLWEPGEIIADTVRLSIPGGLPPNPASYSLDVGLYEFASGIRLAAPGNPDNSVTLATLEFGR